MAYDFISRMGYPSYGKAAEVIQRSSIKDLGFTRADLVHAQYVYGYPAAYLLGQGVHKAKSAGEHDPVPIQECAAQELQVDLFYFLGHAFFLSISVLLGLIMVTHLGPGSNHDPPAGLKAGIKPDKQTTGSKAKAGQSLLAHIGMYMSKGFVINRVTTDGEPAIKAVKAEVEALGIELNVLGHGSHVPHAEAAIKLIKNQYCPQHRLHDPCEMGTFAHRIRRSPR